MSRLAGAVEALFFFAIRLYTRIFTEGEAKHLGGRILLPEKTFKIDNGERVIFIVLRYGPKWEGEFE